MGTGEVASAPTPSPLRSPNETQGQGETHRPGGDQVSFRVRHFSPAIPPSMPNIACNNTLCVYLLIGTFVNNHGATRSFLAGDAPIRVCCLCHQADFQGRPLSPEGLQTSNPSAEPLTANFGVQAT